MLCFCLSYPTESRVPILESPFKLSAHGTDVRTEVVAGVTTFLAAALGTMIMGVYANYPIAMAPGMGLNAYFAYAVVLGMHIPWQAALGAVFISGCLFILVSVLKLRELIVNGIPPSLRTAITVGIGLFLALIALKSAGIVVASPATLVQLGDLHQPQAIMAIVGFLLIVTLDRLKVKGAILIGIVVVTALSFVFGGNALHGVVSAPPSISATLLQFDVKGALSVGILNVVLAFFLVEMFDATGTLMGRSEERRVGKECRSR